MQDFPFPIITYQVITGNYNCMNGDDAQFKKGITELQKAQNEYILQKERENG